MSRVIYAVFPDAKMAEKIARGAVESRLAACANIFPSHLSIYRWNDSIESAQEVAVIFKTVDEKSKALFEYIQSNHSYENPAILEFSITNSTAAFSSWLSNSCLP